MKNKYLTKYLCITLISAMVLSGTVAAFASSDRQEKAKTEAESIEFSAGEDFSDGNNQTQDPSDDHTQVPDGGAGEFTPTPTSGPEPTETPTPEPTETPTVTPEPELSVTPEPTVTPEPEVSPTITPSPTVTPGEENPDLVPGVLPDHTVSENVQEIIDNIKVLSEEVITIEHTARIQEIRTAYEALTDEEKKQVTNYEELVRMEKELEKLGEDKAPVTDDEEKDKESFSDGETQAPVKLGTPVYYTNMATNLHAGKDFYLNSLKNNYQLNFSEDFASVMDSIEEEYKQKNKLENVDELSPTGTTTSADSLLVRNWQDILAVYVYEKTQEGAESFTLDAAAKEDLAEIFAEMNPVVRDKDDITKVTYGNRHINYYIKKNKIGKEDRAILQKYMETDCKLLCATVTAAKGFVRQSVGEDVSEERVNVISAAYSLVGEVGYFWGGKSTTIGMDSNWGSVARVSSEGSASTGTLRAYGLDCSGFVTWAVINGYNSQSMQGAVGDGTSDQWVKANVISEADAQPGDLVFQRGPEAGSDNHVGIICGQTDSGDWIAVHCSSSQNGVTVGEAYSASFRYIRQPSFYPTQEELSEIESQKFVADEAQLQEIEEAEQQAEETNTVPETTEGGQEVFTVPTADAAAGGVADFSAGGNTDSEFTSEESAEGAAQENITDDGAADVSPEGESAETDDREMYSYPRKEAVDPLTIVPMEMAQSDE